jgi:hypothetical protein
MLKGFYLSLYMGAAQTPVPQDVIDHLISVSVTQTAGTSRSGFQMTFGVSKNGSIERDLIPSGFFDPLTRVQIVVTVAGSPTVLMDGLITRQDVAPSNTPGASTLSVTGEDVSVAMDLIELTGLPYPCMPPEARVLLAVAKYAFLGVVPVIIPSVLFEIPNPLDKIPTHSGTDLAYITSLASDAGYVFHVTPGPRGVNTAYWGPEIRYGETQPTLAVNSDAFTNVESLSFGYDGLSAKLFFFMCQIPFTTFSIPIPVPDVGILRPALAQKQPFPFKFEFIEGTNKLGPIGGAAIALARSAQANDAVTGSGSLNVLRYGRILEARKLVDVRGAGPAYDGTYYVKSVTHNIKRGEYKQSFSLAREGVVPTTSKVAL